MLRRVTSGQIHTNLLQNIFHFCLLYFDQLCQLLLFIYYCCLWKFNVENCFSVYFCLFLLLHLFVGCVYIPMCVHVCLSVCLHILLISADINECSIGTHTCNDAQHYCNNTIGNYTCHCNTGYEQYWKNSAQKCRGKGGRTLQGTPWSGVPCSESDLPVI